MTESYTPTGKDKAVNKRIMVKLLVTEQFLKVKTYSRAYKSPFWFYISRSSIKDLKKKIRIIVRDMNSYADLELTEAKGKQMVRMTFSWLSSIGDNALSGYRQTVCLPSEQLQYMCAAETKSEYKFLSDDLSELPRIEIRNSNNLHRVIGNPGLRKKFGLFIGKHFNWPDYARIVIHDDFEPYSFGFSTYTRQGQGICGGIILHNPEDLRKAYYEMHT